MSVARRGGKRDRHPWKSLEEIRKAVCHTYSVQCSDLVTNSITLGTYRQCRPHQVFHSSSSRGPPAGATGKTPWMECLCSVLKTEFKERRSQTLGLRKTCHSLEPFTWSAAHVGVSLPVPACSCVGVHGSVGKGKNAGRSFSPPPSFA